jgi:hypothetical protein
VSASIKDSAALTAERPGLSLGSTASAIAHRQHAQPNKRAIVEREQIAVDLDWFPSSSQRGQLLMWSPLERLRAKSAAASAG